MSTNEEARLEGITEVDWSQIPTKEQSEQRITAMPQTDGAAYVNVRHTLLPSVVPEVLRDDPAFLALAAERRAVMAAWDHDTERQRKHGEEQDRAQREHNEAVERARVTGGDYPEPFRREDLPGTGPNTDPTLFWKQLLGGIYAAEVTYVVEHREELHQKLVARRDFVKAKRELDRAEQALRAAEQQYEPFKVGLGELLKVARPQVRQPPKEAVETFAVDADGHRVGPTVRYRSGASEEMDVAAAPTSALHGRR